MTSSVRGLFVGGKSNSGNTRRTSQRTAPIAENQGGTSPLPDVNLPTEQLSPQASMQVAQLQAEKQEYVKTFSSRRTGQTQSQQALATCNGSQHR